MLYSKIIYALILTSIICCACNGQNKEGEKWTTEVEEPRIVSNEIYPDTIYSDNGESGFVSLLLEIDENGIVDSVSVSESFSPKYDSIAIERLENLKFKPGMRYTDDNPDGTPVSSELGVIFYIRPKDEV